jgi:transposase, IS5 family
VLDHTLEQGNPADAPQLAPAIERVIARTGRRPRTVTADRGYGEKGIDEALHQMGVRTVVIPRKGRPGKDRQAAEHRPMFRRTVEMRGPAAKAGSAPSNAATDGTGPPG